MALDHLPPSNFQATVVRFLLKSFLCLALVQLALSLGNASPSDCHSIFRNGIDSSYIVNDEISKLPEGSLIPEEIYKRFSTNEITNAIINRVRTQEILHPEILHTSDHETIDFKNETDIILFFWTPDIASIEAKGFLNQHQTGKASGEYNPKLRRQVEDNIVGLQIGENDAAAKVREKSAFLNVKTPVDLGEKKVGCIAPQFYAKNPDVNDRLKRRGYGNVAAVFKQEVKDRSLWVVDDSLWLGRKDLRGDIGRLDIRGTFDRPTISKVETGVGSYFEANIFGDLRIADVEYFLVFHESLVPDLIPLGRPIFLAAPVTKFRRVIFEKKALLYAGDGTASK